MRNVSIWNSFCEIELDEHSQDEHHQRSIRLQSFLMELLKVQKSKENIILLKSKNYLLFISPVQHNSILIIQIIEYLEALLIIWWFKFILMKIIKFNLRQIMC